MGHAADGGRREAERSEVRLPARAVPPPHRSAAPPAVSLEQGGSKLVLERAYRGGQGGLGDAQHPRRSGEAPGLGDGEEEFRLPAFHRFSRRMR